MDNKDYTELFLLLKNITDLDYNTDKKIPQSGICPAWCVLRQYTSPLPPLQYINKAFHMSSLHENVVLSICSRMDNAAYIIFIMWNSISGLNTR